MTLTPRIPAETATELAIIVMQDGELFGDDGVAQSLRDLDGEASAALTEALQRWLEA